MNFLKWGLTVWRETITINIVNCGNTQNSRKDMSDDRKKEVS